MYRLGCFQNSEVSNPLGDDRFSAMFSNPDFQVDEESQVRSESILSVIRGAIYHEGFEIIRIALILLCDLCRKHAPSSLSKMPD